MVSPLGGDCTTGLIPVTGGAFELPLSALIPAWVVCWENKKKRPQDLLAIVLISEQWDLAVGVGQRHHPLMEPSSALPIPTLWAFPFCSRGSEFPPLGASMWSRQRPWWGTRL